MTPTLDETAWIEATFATPTDALLRRQYGDWLAEQEGRYADAEAQWMLADILRSGNFGGNGGVICRLRFLSWGIRDIFLDDNGGWRYYARGVEVVRVHHATYWYPPWLPQPATPSVPPSELETCQE